MSSPGSTNPNPTTTEAPAIDASVTRLRYGWGKAPTVPKSQHSFVPPSSRVSAAEAKADRERLAVREWLDREKSKKRLEEERIRQERELEEQKMMASDSTSNENSVEKAEEGVAGDTTMLQVPSEVDSYLHETLGMEQAPEQHGTKEGYADEQKPEASEQRRMRPYLLFIVPFLVIAVVAISLGVIFSRKSTEEPGRNIDGLATLVVGGSMNSTEVPSTAPSQYQLILNQPTALNDESTDEPTATEPLDPTPSPTMKPDTNSPTTNAPSTASPSKAPSSQPTTAQPNTASPMTALPTTALPTTALPTTARPTTALPTTAQPTTASPTTSRPTTAPPTTSQPTTAQPTTARPTAVLLITALPTTASPTTALPTTALPTTARPTTALPITALPTTAPPTTALPTTASPTTALPTTVQPTSAQPTTASPTTTLPTTSRPTTSRPTTALPTTSRPTTASPTTARPTTAQPTTASPTTAQPTTALPTTSRPTTSRPTTALPTTARPTTAQPTTALPTTAQPTTALPTTALPTTTLPTTALPTTAHPTTKLTKSPSPKPTLSIEDAINKELSGRIFDLPGGKCPDGIIGCSFSPGRCYDLALDNLAPYNSQSSNAHSMGLEFSGVSITCTYDWTAEVDLGLFGNVYASGDITATLKKTTNIDVDVAFFFLNQFSEEPNAVDVMTCNATVDVDVDVHIDGVGNWILKILNGVTNFALDFIGDELMEFLCWVFRETGILDGVLIDHYPNLVEKSSA